ncbi:MAG TPA: hypothetical protein VLR27_02530 [Acidimicrobiales bacterium]|nr:hypothetical protein [Acidimicrobiales bacterium]
MTRLPTTEALIVLADAVVTAGFDANRPALDEVVASARQRGIRPVLADIVEDDSAPRPVRERALGRLLVALAAAPAPVDGPVSLVTASAA